MVKVALPWLVDVALRQAVDRAVDDDVAVHRAVYLHVYWAVELTVRPAVYQAMKGASPHPVLDTYLGATESRSRGIS